MAIRLPGGESRAFGYGWVRLDGWFSRDDREAFHLAAVRLAPHVPQSRKGERLFSLEINPHRDLAISFFPPQLAKR